MRVAVLADIGQRVYHVGDEAIGHAVAEHLAARGAEPLLLTHDPEHTRRRFEGAAVAPTLEFPWPPLEREAMLRAVDAAARGHAPQPAGAAVQGFVEVIRGVDAVLIAGGGNLNSTYGWLMYERCAAACVARRFGKPVVLTGQTLGPALTTHDRAVARRLLESCSLVSLREAHSVGLARELAPGHPAIVGGLDDAAAWRRGVRPAPTPGRGRVVATFTPETGELPRGEAVYLLAALLDALAQRFSVEVELVPHMGDPEAGDLDQAFHDEIAAATTSGGVRSLPLRSAAESADAVAGAALVVTSRYHPAVFASARAVPTFALVPDEYSDVRVDGALENHGLAGWAVPLPALRDWRASSALGAVWAERDRVRDHLATHADRLFAGHSRRWDDLVAALGGTPTTPTELAFAPALQPPDAVADARAAHLPALRRAAQDSLRRLEEDRAASLAAAAAGGAVARRDPSPRGASRLSRVWRRS